MAEPVQPLPPTSAQLDALAATIANLSRKLEALEARSPATLDSLTKGQIETLVKRIDELEKRLEAGQRARAQATEGRDSDSERPILW